MVKALALGAEAASLALPFLRAYEADGERGVIEIAETLSQAIRSLLLLTGSRRVQDLRAVPRVLGPRLGRWLDASAPSPAG